ncbi:MAG TPA: glycosyltransferase [Planctomycetota bacterium]|jgi:hopene-associated glycosyltransferase HpnB
MASVLSILLIILSLLTTVSVLAWIFIWMHWARPWDCWPVGDAVPPPPGPENAWPAVAILVPARNEAASLPRTLPALLSQDYPGEFGVIVIDDRSEDGTADVARKIAADRGKQDRLQVLIGAPLPDGWVGKVWALQQGAQQALGSLGRLEAWGLRPEIQQSEAAPQASSLKPQVSIEPAFFLLTDADILHAPGSLRRLVAESSAAKLGLNSRMARLRCISEAEKLLIPAFLFFFNLMYPMRRVNERSDKLAAAAGGCVLLSREALLKLGGGFEPIKSEIIDDVNLARQVKSRGEAIALSLSQSEVVSLREYPHVGDIWKMVRRTAFTELKYSWLRLFGAISGLKLMFVLPLFSVICGAAGVGWGLFASEGPVIAYGLWAMTKGLLALAITGHVYRPTTRFFGLPVFYAFTLPLAGVLYACMTFDSALRHARGKGVQWRDKSARQS